jgi:hypothetical protein
VQDLVEVFVAKLARYLELRADRKSLHDIWKENAPPEMGLSYNKYFETVIKCSFYLESNENTNLLRPLPTFSGSNTPTVKREISCTIAGTFTLSPNSIGISQKSFNGVYLTSLRNDLINVEKERRYEALDKMFIHNKWFLENVMECNTPLVDTILVIPRFIDSSIGKNS